MQNEYEIEIVEVNVIDGGIEVFARAWKNGVQLGFGKDGTIDIERFRIFNPPVLVDDPLGNIVQTWTDEITGEVKTRTLREDPEEAMLQSLTETISIVGKDGANIVAGSRGNTTSTFYASHDAWTDVYDGSFESTFQLAVDWTGSGRVDTTGTSRSLAAYYRYTPDGGYNLERSFFTFDTASTIASGDTISSATLSFYGSDKGINSGSPPTDAAVQIYGCNPGNPNAYVATDYGTILDTGLSTSISYTNWSTAGYNDFALDSNGIARIAKGTGYTTYATSDATYDAANRISSSAGDPTLGENVGLYIRSYFMDQTGTTNDPKLVVEHAAGATFIPRVSFIM